MTRELQQLDPDLTFSLGATGTGIIIDLGSVVPATISRYVHWKLQVTEIIRIPLADR